MHENQNAPPSHSQNCCMNIGTKSDLMNMLETEAHWPDDEPLADAIIIDGSAMINENKRQKSCLWKQRTHYRLENGSLGFIETLHKQ